MFCAVLVLICIGLELGASGIHAMVLQKTMPVMTLGRAVVRQLCSFSTVFSKKRVTSRTLASNYGVTFSTSGLTVQQHNEDDDLGVHIPKDPLGRVARIFKEDMKNLMKGRLIIPEEEYFPHFCDIVIIGGGAMGSSIAYWLKQRVGKALNVVVVEKDPTYRKASTVLSVGGIRQQFSLPENIQMSMYGAQFLREIKKHLSVLDMDLPDVQFAPQGYLVLASEGGVEALKENHLIQRECGARVELLTATQLKQTFPWLNTEGVALGSYGCGQEGWFDPYLLLMAFKQKAISLGARFIKGEVTGFTYRRIPGMTVIDEGKRPYRILNRVLVQTEDGETKDITPAYMILAAGPQSGEVGKLAEIGTGLGMLRTSIPVEPRKRYVYVAHCPNGPGIDCPLVIDSSGAYLRRDGFGGNYLLGKSPTSAEEPDITNLEVDYSFFDNEVWPLIANRVPCFESLKVQSAWAGYYDYNTFDQNAIIGLHPHYTNLILATGFSGHGIQHAPAVGRAITEIIVDGDYTTIDLSRFSFARILQNEPLFERNIF